MNFVPNSDQLAAIFAHASAPAFLVGGVAAFIAILMGRLNLVLDRLRHLREIPESDPLRDKLKGDVPLLKRRAVLLHRAVYLAVLAGISTTLLLLVMIATAFLGVQHIYGGALLFAVATILFTLALIKFAQEVRLALYEYEQF